jgi:hypothetical protein
MERVGVAVGGGGVVLGAEHAPTNRTIHTKNRLVLDMGSPLTMADYIPDTAPTMKKAAPIYGGYLVAFITSKSEVRI